MSRARQVAGWPLDGDGIVAGGMVAAFVGGWLAALCTLGGATQSLVVCLENHAWEQETSLCGLNKTPFIHNCPFML